MIVLALETATPRGGAALLDEAGVVYAELITPGLTHSKTLLPAVDRLLKQNGLTVRELDLITVSVGPGSFTGLRIGLAAAKGLAWASGKPLVGVPTLDVLASGHAPAKFPLCPMIDARRGEVYTALYEYESDGSLKRLTALQALSPGKLAEQIKWKTIFFGDGARVWGDRLAEALGPLYQRAPEELDYPDPGQLARLGLKLFREGAETDPALIIPIYTRLSEAESSRPGKA